VRKCSRRCASASKRPDDERTHCALSAKGGPRCSTIVVIGLALFAEDGARVATLGRLAPNTLRVFELLRRRPIARIGTVVEATGMSFPAAARGIRALEELGVVREITGRKRERVYAYTRYLAILNEGAEPLSQIADAG